VAHRVSSDAAAGTVTDPRGLVLTWIPYVDFKVAR
jgi:hypothetical protein